MSNYEPGTPPGAGQGQEQLFCPNCRGGNSPGATQCQWCGNALAPSTASTTPIGQQPQQQTYAPQQYQQPTPPQPAPGFTPPQAPPPTAPPKRSMRNILLIVAGVALLLIVGCVVLFGSVIAAAFNATQPVADAGERFMSAMRDGDFEGAYNMMTPALQTEFGTLEDFSGRVEGSRPTTWTFTSRNIENNVGKLSGTATFEDSAQGNFGLVLDKVGNDWKVSGIDFNTP